MTSRRQFLGGIAIAAGTLASCSDLTSGQSGDQRSSNSGATSLDAVALEDALVGSSYLGTGGGGSLAEARALIAKDLAVGLTFNALPVAALADTDRVACPYGLASLAPTSPEMQARLGPLADNILQRVVPIFLRELPARLDAIDLGLPD